MKLVLLIVILVATVVLGKLLWKLNITTNTGKFIWLSSSWAIICWFLVGVLFWMPPLYLAISIGFAIYAIYTFSGSVLHRAILSFTFVLPGSASYLLFSPPWKSPWEGSQQLLTLAPPAAVLIVVTLWFIAKQIRPTRRSI